MAPKIRPDQAKDLGGCAPCQFQAQPAGATAAGDGGPKPKSVIVVDPTKEGWIGLEVADTRKRPLANEDFVVTPPNHEPIRGKLDANGKARIEGIDPGTCQIEFPQIDRRDFL